MNSMNRGMFQPIMKVFIALVLAVASINASALDRITYYHNDALGSPVAATNNNGDLLWREAYEPYGKRILRQASSKEELWYTGKQEEAALGVNYFGARWYEPEIGRFMGIDPVGVDVGNVHSFNRYVYANNNPYRYVDPDGNIPIDTIWDIGNVAYDLGKVGYGYFTNNPLMVTQALTDAALDTAALFIPYVPAGVTKIRKADDVVDVAKSAEARANELHSVLDPRAQRARTTAVTETQEGVRVISSSERRLTPAQRAQLGENEVEGVGVGHAEVTGVNAARDMGLTPTGTAASRPICPTCANTLGEQGINPLSPLK